MSLDDLHDAGEYAEASALDLDRMAEILRDVLTGEPKASLTEVLQRQIARSAAGEPTEEAADQGQEPRTEPSETLLPA